MKDPLGDRMKDYEKTYKQRLPFRQPLVLRLDGVHFHTLTKGFTRPWDEDFMLGMNEAALCLANEIQGTAILYVQSDEISVLLIDYKNYNTDPWFGKVIQKMTSVAASIASVGFNTEMEQQDRSERAYFDCRVIPLVREEVTNYFIWRQSDCKRNSVLGYGQHVLGRKAIHGLNCKEIKKNLENVGIREGYSLEASRSEGSWDNLGTHQRLGRVITKVIKRIPVINTYVTAPKGIAPDAYSRTQSCWDVMKETPDFQEERSMIDKLVWPEDEEGFYSQPVEQE